MRAAIRVPILALVFALAVSLASCGSDDKKPATTATTPTVADVPPATAGGTLTPARYAALNTAAEQVVKDLSEIGASTSKCSSSASSPAALGKCVSGRLDEATRQLHRMSATVRDFSREVNGPCQTNLQAFAADVDDLAASFEKAAKALTAGESTAATDVLGTLSLQGVQTTGEAAQRSCRP